MCARGFSPDDLLLDLNGSLICAECTRQKGDAEAAASIEKGLRARRRMQILGIALVVLAALAFGGRMLEMRIDDRRADEFATQTQARVTARLGALRYALGTELEETGDRECDIADLVRRTKGGKVPYVELSHLVGAIGWPVASDDVDELLFFERVKQRATAPKIAATLDRFEASGVVAVLRPMDVSMDVGAPKARWQGRLYLVDSVDFTKLCWHGLTVEDATSEVARTLTRTARYRLGAMTNKELDLRY